MSNNKAMSAALQANTKTTIAIMNVTETMINMDSIN